MTDKMKRKHKKLTAEYLANRSFNTVRAGYTEPKWILFSKKLMAEGFVIRLYEARKTVSKYITVIKPGSYLKPFKVRFSNHAPIRYHEENGDCDFFVGRTHLNTTTTSDAIMAVFEYFKE
jgi:hypothetical protein